LDRYNEPCNLPVKIISDTFQISNLTGKVFIELLTNEGTPCLFLMGRGDFSLPARSVSAKAGRPDFGRLKPPLPKQEVAFSDFL
jgi:hypothetical protein